MNNCAIFLKAKRLPMGSRIQLADGGWMECRKGWFRCIEAWIEKDGIHTFRVFNPETEIEIID